MAGKPKVKKGPSDYNKFIKKELKGKTGPGYKGRFKAAVRKWNASRKAGRKPRVGQPPRRQRRLAGGPPRTRARPRATRARKPTSGGKRRVAGFNQQKIFKYVRLAALALPAASIAMSGASTQNKLSEAKRQYFGVEPDGRINMAGLAKGWGPFAMSILVTYGLPKLAGMLRSL